MDTTPITKFRKAYQRLQHAPLLPRLSWLLEFIEENATTGLTSKQHERLGWEALAYSWGSHFSTAYGITGSLNDMILPSQEELDRTAQWARRIISNLVDRGEARLPNDPEPRELVLVYTNGQVVKKRNSPHAHEATNWMVDFRHETRRLLQSLHDHKTKLLACPHCHKPFLAQGKQLHCSGKCSSSVRSQRHRLNNPEAWKAYRRNLYKRNKAKKAKKDIDEISIRSYSRSLNTSKST